MGQFHPSSHQPWQEEAGVEDGNRARSRPRRLMYVQVPSDRVRHHGDPCSPIIAPAALDRWPQSRRAKHFSAVVSEKTPPRNTFAPKAKHNLPSRETPVSPAKALFGRGLAIPAVRPGRGSEERSERECPPENGPRVRKRAIRRCRYRDHSLQEG